MSFPCCAFEFVLRDGTVSIPAIGFAGGVVRLGLDHGACDSSQLRWQRQGSWAVAACEGLEIRLGADERGLTVVVKNGGQMPVSLADVTVQFDPRRLANAPAAEDYLEFIHSLCFEEVSGVKRVGLPNRWLPPERPSSMLYVLHHRKSGRAWLFSTLPPHAGDYVTFRALHECAHMEGRFGLEIRSELACLIPPGQSVSTSTIQCRCGEDATALLAELGQQWQAARPDPLKPTRLGWNSWDFFASAVTSKDVLENTRAARDVFGVSKPDVVIDGGWEERWGAWEPNAQFPDGLEWMAAAITREGGVPGIWIAPLMVYVYTRLFRDHSDWLVRDRAGQILDRSYAYGQCGMLDITHPQVQALVRDTFIRLRGCGFRTFKVDFSQHVLQGGRFHDPTLPRGAIIRKLFQIVREAIGPDSYLLACGAPYESVTGLADAARTTGDIHNYWSHVLMNLSGLAARWWMHGRLWNNDPDSLIVRTPENCPGEPLNRPRNPKPLAYGQVWLAGREFNQREAQSYALLVLLAGGDILLGDHLPALNEQGEELIRRVLQNRLSRPAVPLDLFQSHEGLPSLWLAREEDHWLLGVFNWEEDVKQSQVDLAELGIAGSAGIRSFWDDQPIRTEQGIIRVTLEPRACVGLRIDRPEFRRQCAQPR